MLECFSNACKHLKRPQKYKVWQDGYHAKEIIKPAFFEEKLDYIHNNPVKDGIVEFPEDYLYSSARNYAELDSLIDIIQLINRTLSGLQDRARSPVLNYIQSFSMYLSTLLVFFQEIERDIY